MKICFFVCILYFDQNFLFSIDETGWVVYNNKKEGRMKTNFNEIPEFIIFKELTSMDGMFGRGVIDPNYESSYYKKEERLEYFKKVLNYYRENNFEEMLREYINVKANRKLSTMYGEYNNYTFNHPLVVMLSMFIEQGMLTRDLRFNPDMKLLDLSVEIDRKKLRQLNITEGVIFADGKLLKVESSEAHKIAALWILLTGRNLRKAVRYTDDCIHPEPIFSSMDEYAKLGDGSIKITDAQARAMYNIHLAKSRRVDDFESVLGNSGDLCITPHGDPQIRYANCKTFENELGSELFSARKVLERLKEDSFLV